MLRELRALELLAVGDVVWSVDSKTKVMSTMGQCRKARENQRQRECSYTMQNCAKRLQSRTLALQLAISFPTLSAEALRVFLCCAAELDLTAFLCAEQTPRLQVPQRALQPNRAKRVLAVKEILQRSSGSSKFSFCLVGCDFFFFGLTPLYYISSAVGRSCWARHNR